MTARNTKGFALIMTLWVLVFLTIVVMSFTLSAKLSVTSASNFRQTTEAYYLALSGYDIALNYLMDDDDKQVDFVDEDGVFHVDTEHEPIGEPISLYNGNIEIKIKDEQAKQNINRISQDRLRKVLRAAGVDEVDVEEELVDCLLDWVDADDAHHLNGVEDEFYEDFGYKSKNGPLDTLDELLLVKGYSKELLHGSDKYKALDSLLTVFGNGALNVNTVGEDVLNALGVNQIDIENIMRYRNIESGGLKAVPANLRAYGLAAYSTYLGIEVSAEVRESGIKYVLTAVVKRTPAENGYKLDTVFWRENVVYS